MFSQACVKNSVHRGGGEAWQERRPLQRTVRILLECILVVNFLRDTGSMCLYILNSSHKRV